MNSQRQSSAMTSISIGEAEDWRCFGGSSSWEPIQAMPPKNKITKPGMAQTMSSMLPEYSQSARYTARRLPLRNHQANARVRTMTGMMTDSMMIVAPPSMRVDLCSEGA